VEAALAALPDGGTALDLCTGTGCVGVTLALERSSARVTAVDLSPDALALARENAAALGAATIELLEGDLYAPLAEGVRFDVIAANPPYVPSREVPKLARELAHEPALALDGGDAGLLVTGPLVRGALARLRPGGTLAVEMHESHAQILPALCAEAGLVGAEVRLDLAGLPRLVVARAPGAT
jgi:release factor glutamine methyltransferase